LIGRPLPLPAQRPANLGPGRQRRRPSRGPTAPRPLQQPAGGPNFYEFGDDVLYEIHVDNSGDGRPDISYPFRFRTTLRDPGTFPYNTGPIKSLNSPNWNSRQFYSVTRVEHGSRRVLGAGPPTPPSTPAWPPATTRSGRIQPSRPARSPSTVAR